MWYISSAGDVLQGKTRWLRPGKAYTVGRADANDIVIHGKSISRKHATLTVNAVPAGSFARTSAREHVQVHDEETKFGTFVGESRIPTGGEADISQVGGRKHVKIDNGTVDMKTLELRFGKVATDNTKLILEWQPIVLTVSSNSDLGNLDGLEQMGVKVLSEFHPSTTHYVKGERNSSKMLEALVNLVPVVSTDYVKALVASADGLEQDFLGGLPDASKYLPDPRYGVRHERKEIFEGVVFVFFDKQQRNALAHVVNLAGGKSLYYELHSTSTVYEIKSYLNLHAKSALLMRHPGQQGSDKDSSDSSQMLQNLGTAAKEMSLSFVEPANFLEAILSCKTDTLHKTAEPGRISGDAMAATAAASVLQQSFVKQEPSWQPKPSRRPAGKQLDLINFLTGGKRKQGESQSQLQSQKSSVAAESEQSTGNRYTRQGKEAQRLSERATIASQSLEAEVYPNRSKMLKNSESANAMEASEPKSSVLEAMISQPSQAAVRDTSPPAPEPVTSTAASSTKRKASGAVQSKATRKSRAVEPDEAEGMFDNDDGVEDVPATEIDLNEPLTELQLGDLAAVENSMDLAPRKELEAQHQWATNDNSRPNFKRFRRKGTAAAASREPPRGMHVELETAPITSREDNLADAMFVSMSQPAGQSSRTKRQGVSTNSMQVDFDDDSLFVASQEPEAPAQGQPSARATIHDDDEDDEIFGFRFSR